MSIDRREMFAALAALGVGPAVFQRAAVTLAADPEKPTGITPEMVKQAEWIAGVNLSEDDRKKVAQVLTRGIGSRDAARKMELTNDVAPAIRFDPTPGVAATTGPRGAVAATPLKLQKPAGDDNVAFLSIGQLGHLLRTKQLSSVELTKLYLERLKKYDPALKCVITLTDDLAMKQAKRADEELAAGKDRGPLHGIPWGAKDLIAVPGYKTTWGAAQYKDQNLDTTATVAKRLDDAGAVLVAKLSLGALAYNDIWFGGRTNNPWNIKEGSSGSSAGSACATVAGLVGFALGSETLGSIVSPSTRCGATGLRPTFGRVSRAGCMALAWTMDKIGPLCRSVEDCALVLGVIHGADGLDPTAVNRPFSWPAAKPLNELRVGYTGKDEERADLKVLKSLGVTLVPITLPQRLAGLIVNTILNAEAGAAFDELIRAGKLDKIGALWPTSFQASQFVTAVDYIRANRIRSRLMAEMAKEMEKVDLYVGGGDLTITNLTGHPTVCLPDGFTKRGGAEVPKSLTFTGRLYGEAELLAVAKAYQDATGHHLKRPPQEKWVVEKPAEAGEKPTEKKDGPAKDK
jgi:Asp-tRNA(Asn)/Glu-tRNA(Gln) amidotransferase A subunit family amidase